MDEKALRLASAPPTRGLIEMLVGRVASEDLRSYAEEALAAGEIRAL